MYILLILLLATAHYTSGQGCQGSATVQPQDGYWEEDGIPRRVFDVEIKNTGTCYFTAVTVDVIMPPGANMGISWGYSLSSHVVSGFGRLSPGQTYQGTGFVMSGHGEPTANVVAFTNCTCPTSPTTGSLDPSDPVTTGSSTTGGPAPTGPYYSVGIKFLILTCTATDIRAGVARTILESVGTPYDVIVQTAQLTSPLNLVNSDSTGKYAAIVAATELACWSRDQQIEIESYEIQYQSKTVIMYSYPYPTNGVTVRPEGGIALGTGVATASFAPAMLPAVPFYRSGTTIDITGVFCYPSTISNANLATPAIYINVGGTQYVGAAFIKYPDNRRRLEFYFDSAEWALFAALLGPAWFQWASNGVFAGARRIEFNAQIDDIFMATGMFNAATGDEDKNNLYRITPGDLIAVKNWQDGVTARLPPGSRFVLTFPFNGATVIEKGGYATDALYLTAKQYRDSFYWESHTYTHPYLDNLTYAEVLSEFTRNAETANQLFDNDLSNPNFCKKSVITPSITGLFNGNALRAMYDFGIRNVVGDNSRAELIPPNLYHGFYTTVVPNGFDGMFVIPRHATNIYYDGSIPGDIETQFNFKYSASLGTLTFPQIVQRDVTVALKSLLEYRHDPFMFHQANMRSFPYEDSTGTSLLAYWVDAVVDELLKYTSLPVLSHNHDDLAQKYVDRESRDTCGVTGVYKIDQPTNSIVGLKVQSTGSCKYAFSGAWATASGAVTTETYGSEKTIWIQMTPGQQVDLTFTTPVPLLF